MEPPKFQYPKRIESTATVDSLTLELLKGINNSERNSSKSAIEPGSLSESIGELSANAANNIMKALESDSLDLKDLMKSSPRTSAQNNYNTSDMSLSLMSMDKLSDSMAFMSMDTVNALGNDSNFSQNVLNKVMDEIGRENDLECDEDGDVKVHQV